MLFGAFSPIRPCGTVSERPLGDTSPGPFPSKRLTRPSAFCGPMPSGESATTQVGRLSVITVTYNSEALVSGALSSVEAAARDQGVTPELIVVDNASVDGTRDVLQREFPNATVVA